MALHVFVLLLVVCLLFSLALLCVNAIIIEALPNFWGTEGAVVNSACLLM
jgi:hypothetical protein